jgi:hypothetical protein
MRDVDTDNDRKPTLLTSRSRSQAARLADARSPGPQALLDRAGRIAFTFVLMNSAAVMALVSVVFRRKVWR